MRGAVLVGGEDLLRDLTKLEDAVKGHALLKAVEEGADILEPEIIARAPEGEGELKRSIQTKSRTVRPTRAQTETGPTVIHGVFQELGTEDMEANPYMRPALKAKAKEITRAIADSLRARIERIRGVGG